MGTDKDLEAKKDLETQKDADTKKAPETGEQSIEYLVEGLAEEELKQVSGGRTPGLATKLPSDCNLCVGVVVPHCVSYYCDGYDPSKDCLGMKK
jgi:hypothetical protein